ncbi:MAG: YaiI/YqxD family protein [Rhodobiaceae bacterium]|nr:YaiI/YqxD family protein [Rhodobiaceae bacterium]MCC0049984.1 YaiI/YqxD family protein [Rhodobiaceae bacterium]
MTIIYIDADACPVKEETVAVAERHGVQVKIVSNGGLRPIRHPLVEMVYVAEGPDVADDWIAGRVAPGDICITTDIPLASRCIKAGGSVLKPNGEALSEANIGAVLATRNLMADLREQGAVTNHHAAFSAKDRSHFRQSLDRLLRRLR